jgi:hypothetical protein
MKRGNQNEHGFDCVSYMALASPHRWSAVRNFLVDLNGTVNFKVKLDESFCCHGSCGLRPDVALMQKEVADPIDTMGDRLNWSPKQRQAERWIYDHIAKVSRVHWIQEQVQETLITGTAPFSMMTPMEQNRFLFLLRKAKEAKAKNLKYQHNVDCYNR